MDNAFKKGRHITKAPRGYKLLNKQLIVDPEESVQIKNIFEEFLNTHISLTQLGKKNGMTTTGIIKLLKNTTYLGKVKFANHESNGQHESIVDKQLFEQVQNKFSH
jgi:DNA invertase Pin-like site-specific DNA recombinase